MQSVVSLLGLLSLVQRIDYIIIIMFTGGLINYVWLLGLELEWIEGLRQSFWGRKIESLFYAETWPWLEPGPCPYMHDRSP